MRQGGYQSVSKLVVAFVSLALVGAVALAANSAAESQSTVYHAILTSIEFEITHTEELSRYEQEVVPEDAALVGDAVKVVATLKSTMADTEYVDEGGETRTKLVSVASGPFEVAFYFKNLVTSETGLIGREWVYGFEGGHENAEILRPTINWDPAKQEPGQYLIMANGSFEVAAEPAEMFFIKNGKYIEFRYPIPSLNKHIDSVSCLLGGTLEGSYSFEIVNLGSLPVKLEDFQPLSSAYRIEGQLRFTDFPFNSHWELQWLLPSELKPSEPGTLRLTPVYPLFPPDFQASTFGDGKKVQFRIQAPGPDNSGQVESPPIYTPSRTDAWTLFSWAEPWTFPLPGDCAGPEFHQEADAVKVPPVFAQSRLLDRAFVAIYNATENKSRLYSLLAADGYDSDKAESAEIDGEIVVLSATTHSTPLRVCAGTAEGKLSCFDGLTMAELWLVEVGPGLQKPCFYEDRSEGLVVVVGSESGLLGLKGELGNKLWETTEVAPVIVPPVSFEESKYIWLVKGTPEASIVYLYSAADAVARGKPIQVTSYSTTSPVVTPLVPAQNYNRVFFATSDKRLWAEGPELGDELTSVVSDWPITGLAVVGEEPANTVIYLATSRVDILKVEPDLDNGGFGEPVSLRDRLPDNVPEGKPNAPAVLVEAGIPEAVFVSTDSGRLYGYAEDLGAMVKVLLWPPKEYQNFGENPEYKVPRKPGSTELLDTDKRLPDAYWIDFEFTTKDEKGKPAAMTQPVIWHIGPDQILLAIGAKDGHCYAFDLGKLY
ncbi:hypothetical protein KAX17_11485 [Candidatus Bipolaricaulota bacterium]|nr:hypothetical protein [Candidatus Bipolaricaulota bacterium]